MTIKESEVPANAMGGSSSTSGPIQIFDPLLRKSNNLLKRMQANIKKLQKKKIEKTKIRK